MTQIESQIKLQEGFGNKEGLENRLNGIGYIQYINIKQKSEGYRGNSEK